MPAFDECRLRDRDLRALLVYVSGLQSRAERERMDAAIAEELVDSLLILLGPPGKS